MCCGIHYRIYLWLYLWKVNRIMEPEWNNPPELDDSTMLGLRNDKFVTSHFGWLKNRVWSLRPSFSKRVCYITGENIQFKMAYRGRKPIRSIMSRNKISYDDIWICSQEYINLILSGKIC